MSIPDEEVIKKIENIRIEIDNYTISVQSILALINVFTIDNGTKRKLPNSNYGIGREMTTSKNNKVISNQNVTPDIVIQRNKDRGFVIEVKGSLPRNKDLWKDDINQLVKYDDPNLMGWWTEDEIIGSTNLIGLLHQTRAVDFYDVLLEELSISKTELDNPFAIIQYTRDIQYQTFINLQKIRGEIINQELDQRLHSSIAVPIEKVISNPDYVDLKFYDVPPSVEYIMLLLWQDLFPGKNVEQGIYHKESKSNEFLVSVTDLTEDLQKAYGSIANGPREKNFPLNDWIRNALNMFVSIGLAAQHNENEFTVFYKEFKSKDIIEEFAERMVRLDNDIIVDSESDQLELFDKSEGK